MGGTTNTPHQAPSCPSQQLPSPGRTRPGLTGCRMCLFRSCRGCRGSRPRSRCCGVSLLSRSGTWPCPACPERLRSAPGPGTRSGTRPGEPECGECPQLGSGRRSVGALQGQQRAVDAGALPQPLSPGRGVPGSLRARQVDEAQLGHPQVPREAPVGSHSFTWICEDRGG